MGLLNFIVIAPSALAVFDVGLSSAQVRWGWVTWELTAYLAIHSIDSLTGRLHRHQITFCQCVHVYFKQSCDHDFIIKDYGIQVLIVPQRKKCLAETATEIHSTVKRAKNNIYIYIFKRQIELWNMVWFRIVVNVWNYLKKSCSYIWIHKRWCYKDIKSEINVQRIISWHFCKLLLKTKKM